MDSDLLRLGGLALALVIFAVVVMSSAGRSEYQDYVRRRKALDAQREDYERSQEVRLSYPGTLTSDEIGEIRRRWFLRYARAHNDEHRPVSQ